MTTTVHLLDYGAGNVRSIRNAIKACGFVVEDVTSPAELADARVLVFPGVGAFGSAMEFLHSKGFAGPLLDYLRAGKPYMGICLGMQTLFQGSDESPEAGSGLGIIPGRVTRFPASDSFSVPHIGWNGLALHKPAPALAAVGPEDRVYFVHSYRAQPTVENASFVAATCDYGDGPFIAAVASGNIFATQFHPEKSGEVGLGIFRAFLQAALQVTSPDAPSGTTVESLMSGASVSPSGSSPLTMASPLYPVLEPAARPKTQLAKRVIACLDVRSNDDGDLVVTKGDKYDVREKAPEPAAAATVAGAGADASALGAAARPVRNLGKPVDLTDRYYKEGADEVVCLNITAFRSQPLEDQPLLAMLEAASERVFVPLTIGGGIRAYVDESGRSYSALDVAARYFRAGADKVSIGSDAVAEAEAFWARGSGSGSGAIETIARQYGRQAVVVSVDPRRVYIAGDGAGPDADAARAAGHELVHVAAKDAGPAGERWCWYECTVRGGREGRPLCAHRLARAVEALGAGELLVNCVDNDGQKGGYDEALLASLKACVSIPVIASSGAGTAQHFVSVFASAGVEAALAAGIFHRHEVGIAEVKAAVRAAGMPVRAVVRAAAAAPAAASAAVTSA